MNETISKKIISLLKPVAGSIAVSDVRVGLGYTSVRLDNGNAGIAWTAGSNSGSCTHMAKAGTLAGKPADELLELLGSPNNQLLRTIGLATANALSLNLPQAESTKTDALELVNIEAADNVAMVGFFGPLIPQIRQKGCKLDIIELNEKPGTLNPEQGKAALSSCSVAIITATSIVTGTIDDLLANLGSPRAVVILGPSTFMRAEVFKETGVTHLAGSKVLNAGAVERIVSEGGGTMLLKPHIEFNTVFVK